MHNSGVLRRESVGVSGQHGQALCLHLSLHAAISRCGIIPHLPTPPERVKKSPSGGRAKSEATKVTRKSGLQSNLTRPLQQEGP